MTAFQHKNLADHRIVKVINENAVTVATPDHRERKCTIHHIKPISPVEALLAHLRSSQSVSKETILTC